MSEPILRLEPTRLSVDPGGQVTAVLTVYNPGHRVEGYDLDVVGQSPMPWATSTRRSSRSTPSRKRRPW